VTALVAAVTDLIEFNYMNQLETITCRNDLKGRYWHEADQPADCEVRHERTADVEPSFIGNLSFL